MNLPCRALGMSLAAAVLMGTVWSSTAHADEPWMMSGSLSGSTVLTEPQRDAYGAGVAADLGLYRAFAPWVLVGGRLGGVLLARDQQIAQASDDHGAFTMARLGAVVRVRPLAIRDEVRRSTGLWIETGMGPGLSDGGANKLHLMLEGGVGYGFDAGVVTIGPALRYQQVIEAGRAWGGDDTRLASLGIEVSFLDYRPRLIPADTSDGATDPDRDGDGIMDNFDKCDGEPETYNGINDHDGCPDTGTLSLIDGRIVVDERVFFDFDQAELSVRGRQTLQEIHDMYEDGHWQFIQIEGHADSRGTAAYNRDLSGQRANVVRNTLIQLGVPAGAMRPVSFGESAPIYVAAHTEAQHALNRRVEFVVTPASPVATPPAATP